MWLPWRRTASPESPSPAAPAQIETSPRPAHWAGLPPIQRVVAEQPVVLEPGAFEAGLQSWQSPAFLAPLEHLVSADGPFGSADLARPQSYAPTADMPLRQPPAPRPARIQRAISSAPAAQSTLSPRSALLAAPPVDHPAMELRTESVPQPAGDGVLPDVHRAEAGPAVETAPLLGYRDAAGVDIPADSPAAPETLPTLAERRALDSSPSAVVSRLTMPALPAPANVEDGGTTPSVATAAVPSPAPTAWRTRPGGIGAPLREMPVRPLSPTQAAIQRSTSGPIVAASTRPSSAQPSAGLPMVAPATDASTEATTASGGFGASSTPAEMPLVAPTLGTASIASLDVPAGAVESDPSGSTPASPTPSSPTPSSPTFSSTPSSSLRAGDAVGSSYAESATGVRLVLPALGGSWREPTSAPVQRRALVGESPLRPSIAPAATDPVRGQSVAFSARAGSPTTEPSLQRLGVGPSGPAADGGGFGVRPDSWAPVESAAIGSLPSAMTPAGSSSASSAPVRAGSAAQTMPALAPASVAGMPSPMSGWSTSSQPTALRQPSATTVSRLGLAEPVTAATASATFTDPNAVVARQVDAMTDSPTETVMTNPVATVAREAESAASAPTAPAPAAGAAGPDLDDLARKLYDRLRGRLAAELRLDRERVGSLTDLRR